MDEGRIRATTEWSPLTVADAARFTELPIAAGALTGPVAIRWNRGLLHLQGKLSGTLDQHALEDVAFDIVRDGERIIARRAAGVVSTASNSKSKARTATGRCAPPPRWSTSTFGACGPVPQRGPSID